MNSLRRTLVVCALALLAVGTGAPARAAELTFGVLQSNAATPSILIEVATGRVVSLDLPTGYADAFDPSSRTAYTQVIPGAGPFPSLFRMSLLEPVGPVDPTTTQYGPGSFGVAIDTGASSVPWLLGSFSTAFLSLAPDLSSGVLFNTGGTTYSGAGFSASTTSNPGSFAFLLGNPVRFTDGDVLTALAYEITLGAFSAPAGTTTVPEPSTILLVGAGFVLALARRRAR